MLPVRHFSQLVVWQLAERIRIHVFGMTKRPHFARDFKARGQAEDAADSVCRNIAEGFGCESHDEFARYLVIARRSLNELRDGLHSAQLKKYVDASDLAPIGQLSNRIYPAFSRLIAYLRSTPTPKRRSLGRNGHRRPDNDQAPTNERDARTDKGHELRTDRRERTRTDKRRGVRIDKRQ